MLIILLLMLGFAIVHSITADKRVKEWVSHTFGDRLRHGWYRLFYNILSVLMLLPIFIYMTTQSTILFSAPSWLTPIFLGIQLIGIIGVIVSVLQIDWMRFVGLRQVIAYFSGADLPLPDENLKTDGIYGIVRHPLYLFSLMFLWFSPILTVGALMFNISATAYFVIGSIIEERRMLQYYGESYTKYRQSVPWLLPFPRF